MNRRWWIGFAVVLLVLTSLLVLASIDGADANLQPKPPPPLLPTPDLPRSPLAPTPELTARPFTDAEAVKEGPTYCIRLRDAEEHPIGGASVGICPTRANFVIGEEFPYGVTDSEGRVMFAGIPPYDHSLVVCAPGRLATRFELGSQPEQDFVLRDRPALAGRVLVNGGAPEEAVPLVFRGFRDPVLNWTPSEKHFYAVCARTPGVLALRTREDGAFSVFGIEPSDEATVDVGDRYTLSRKNYIRHELMVRAVDLGVLIELDDARAITGRLLNRDSDLASLMQLLSVHWQVKLADGTAKEGSFAARPQERFRIVIHDWEVVEFAMMVERVPENTVVLRRKVIERIGSALDLGDLRYPEVVETRRLRVINEEGEPIRGARARYASRVSKPSGLEGWIDLDAGEFGGDLQIGAPGYQFKALERPSDGEWPREVTLSHSVGLRLTVRSPDGAAELPGLLVSIEQKGALPNHSPDRCPELAALRGKAPGGMVLGPGEHRLVYELDSDGTLTLTGFPRGVEVRVRVLDLTDVELAQAAVTLDAEVLRHIELPLPRGPRSFRGTIRNRRGEPMAGVTVVAAGGPAAPTTRTDIAGRFELEGLYGEAVQFAASCPGFVTRWFTEAQLRDGPLEMAYARTVIAEVVDKAAQHIDAGIHAEFEGGRVFVGERIARGTYRLEGLPDEAGTVVVQFGKQQRKETLWPKQSQILVFENP